MGYKLSGGWSESLTCSKGRNRGRTCFHGFPPIVPGCPGFPTVFKKGVARVSPDAPLLKTGVIRSTPLTIPPLHGARLSGMVAGTAVPNNRLYGSTSVPADDLVARPNCRLLLFPQNSSFLICLSSCQNTYSGFFRNPLWMWVSRLRACRFGEPLPNSPRTLPVPYG